MSGNLAPRHYGDLTQQSHDLSAPRLPARVQRAINQEAVWGLVQAARAQAVAFATKSRIGAAERVAEEAMFRLDRLHRVEASMFRADPLQAERYNTLLNDFLMVARAEIRRLPEEF